MSYLERLQAKAAMNAAGEPLKGAKAPSDPFEGDRIGSYWGLPVDMVVGLRRLATMPTPRLILPEGWPAAVADALMLTTDGWAAKALALGWSPLEVFGAVTDRNGYSGADGLAVWLGGRSVLAIAETYASVGDGIGRAYFNHSTCLAETLLWDIGGVTVK